MNAGARVICRRGGMSRRRISPGENRAGDRVHAGDDQRGRKELIGFQVSVRKSAQSWRELLDDVQERCWFHNTAKLIQAAA